MKNTLKMEHSFSDSSESEDVDRMKIAQLANSITTDSPAKMIKGGSKKKKDASASSQESETYDIEELGSPNTTISGLYFSPLRTPATEKKVKRKMPEESASGSSTSKSKKKSKKSLSSPKKLKLNESAEDTGIPKASLSLSQPRREDSSENEDEMDSVAYNETVVESTKPNKRLSYTCPPGFNRTTFTDHSCWAEDIQKSKLWLIKVPADFNMSSLKKTKLLKGITVPIGKEDIKDETYQWQMESTQSTNENSLYSVLLPSKKDKDPKFVGQFSGEIHITKHLTVNPYMMLPSEKRKHQLPEGLKMRNTPFGADGPVPKLSNNGQVVEASRRSSEGDIFHDNSFKSTEKTKHAKKKKKQKHKEKLTKEEKSPKCLDNDSNKAASRRDTVDSSVSQSDTSFQKYSKDVRNESLKEHKRKKKRVKEESISDTNVIIQAENIKQEASTNLELKVEPVEIKQEVIIKEECTEDTSQKKKKKKKKAKDKLDECEGNTFEKDINSNSSPVENVIIDTLIKQEPGQEESEAKNKKKKKKHKSHKKTKEESDVLNVDKIKQEKEEN